MTYRYTYKITCTQGKYKDHFYYGQHTTDDINDGYKGSGKKLKSYYKKHPNDYIKEIISFHNSQEELDKAEYELIHPYLNDPYCLNIAEGGKSNRHPQSEETRKKISKGLKGKKYKKTHQSWLKGKHGVFSKERLNQISEQHKNTKWMTLNNHHVKAKENEINHYLELGYHFGRK